jgi:hypothetical protein
MNAKKVWCRFCNKMVEVAVDKAVTSVALPFFGSAAGGAIGGGKAGLGGGLVGAAIGAAAGFLAHELLVPKAQAVLCPGCKCELA